MLQYSIICLKGLSNGFKIYIWFTTSHVWVLYKQRGCQVSCKMYTAEITSWFLPSKAVSANFGASRDGSLWYLLASTHRQDMYLSASLSLPLASSPYWMWWCTPLIPALGRRRQVYLWVLGQPDLHSELQDSQKYIVWPLSPVRQSLSHWIWRLLKRTFAFP